MLDKKQLTILLLAGLILSGLAVYRYLPLIRKKLEMKKQISRQDQTMQQIQQYSGKLPELRQEKERLWEQLTDYSLKVPEGKQFAHLWNQIADMMNTCSLAEQLIRPGQEKKSDKLCCIPLTIECSGTLDQMFDFFQSLESLDRMVRLEEIKLVNSNDFDATVKLNATANIYYQPESADNG